jgi:ATP-dependent RNA helicase DOB1
MEGRLIVNPLFHSPDLERIYKQYQTKVDVSTKIKTLKKKIQAANAIMQLDELKNRKRVLRRLGFTSSSDVIEMKGRFVLWSDTSNSPESHVRLVLRMNSF